MSESQYIYATLRGKDTIEDRKYVVCMSVYTRVYAEPVIKIYIQWIDPMFPMQINPSDSIYAITLSMSTSKAIFLYFSLLTSLSNNMMIYSHLDLLDYCDIFHSPERKCNPFITLFTFLLYSPTHTGRQTNIFTSIYSNPN